MRPDYITSEFLKNFISSAFAEDVGDGDHSTLAAIPQAATNAAVLKIKDNGILAGVDMAVEIFRHYDPTLELEIFVADGTPVKAGSLGFTVRGSSRSILTCERLVLNCMQRMSGIATKTNHLVKLLEGTSTRLLDTRKTTPNFRLLEKWGVKIGGGHNHRIGLYDMIMLKDNHIDMAGGITQAINQTKDYLRASNKTLKIEVETRTLKEVEEVLTVGGVEVIMLDNMDIATMKAAVKLIGNMAKTEASGNITETTLRGVADCGVDFISVGALTHSYKSLDLSLKAEKI
ncbi:MAG: carboxylating nicotinate-nucleotide diphosphorylase [Cytophagia bacterium]|nr:carboxylating nicotinate-nucleotide diphosphorylase [Cytophagia bacterium]